MAKKSVDQDHDPQTGEVRETTVNDIPVHKRRHKQYDLEDFINRQTKRGYTGSLQHVSSIPMEPPIGYTPQQSIFEQMKAMLDAKVDALRQELQNADEMETLEEADDFEVGDPEDFIPSSPYEGNFDVSVKELLDAGNKVLLEKKEAEEKRQRPNAVSEEKLKVNNKSESNAVSEPRPSADRPSGPPD